MSAGDKQIDQMMAFIKQEAIEKAEEIKWKTDAEVNATKLNLIRKKRQELNELYIKKEKDVKIQKDIDVFFQRASNITQCFDQKFCNFFMDYF